MKSALQPGMRVHLVVHLEPDPRLGDLGVLIFQAMVSSMNWRLDGGRWHTRVELLGYRQSEAAKAANLAIALRVLPGVRRVWLFGVAGWRSWTALEFLHETIQELGLR